MRRQLLLLFFLFNTTLQQGDENEPTALETGDGDAEALYNKTYAEHETQLEKDLFKNYNPLVRPVRNESERLDVSLHWHLVHASVNQREQTMNIHGHLYMNWIDEKLGWDPDDYNGIRITRSKKWQVWHPKISVANSVSGVYSVFEISSQAHVLIQTIGKKAGAKIEMYPTFSIKAGCIFDYSDFPDDDNTCAITTYTTESADKVVLRVYGPSIPPTIMFGWGKHSDKSIISDFEIYNVSNHAIWYRQGNISEYEPLTDDEAANSWSMMRLIISFRRHSDLFGISIVLPSIITFSITLLAFYMPNVVHGIYVLTANLIIQAVFLEDLTKTVPLVVSKVPRSIAVYGEILLLNTFAIAIHVGLLTLQSLTESKLPSFLQSMLEVFRPVAVGKLEKNKGEEMSWSQAVPLLRPLGAVAVVIAFFGGYIASMIY